MTTYILKDGVIESTLSDERKDGYIFLFNDGVFIKKSWVNHDGIHFNDLTLAKIAQNAATGRLDKTLEALGLGGQA